MLLYVFMSCSLSSYFLMDFAAAFLPWCKRSRANKAFLCSSIFESISPSLLCELHVFALDVWTWFTTKTRDVLTGFPMSRLNSAADEDCAEGLPREVTTKQWLGYHSLLQVLLCYTEIKCYYWPVRDIIHFILFLNYMLFSSCTVGHFVFIFNCMGNITHTASEALIGALHSKF